MKFIARTLLTMLITILIASFIIFGAMHAAPGDPVTVLIGNPENITPERVAEVRAQYHLDQPFLAQYWYWLSGVLTGNLGASYLYHQPVAMLIGSRITTSLSLVALSTVMLALIGIGLGIASAVKRGRALDSFVVGSTTLLASIPSFVAGIGFVAVFSVWLGWFPVAGSGIGVLSTIHHLFLPALAMAIGAVAIVSRVTRQSMIEQFGRDHVEAARAYGLGEASVITRHVLRNSWGPILTMVSLIVASMIAGTVAVETVFGLSGIGSLLVDSINSHDFPVVQATLLIMVVAYMLVTTLVDLLHPLIDPRVTTGRTVA